MQGHIGACHRRLQQPHKARGHGLDRLLLKEIQAVFEPALNAKGLSFRAQALAQAERQVELCDFQRDRPRDRSPSPAGPALPRERSAARA